MKKSSLALAAAALAFAPAIAHSANYFAPSEIYHGSGVVLFQNKAEVAGYPNAGFRIPAVAAGNGIVIAATDVRYHSGDYDLTSWGAGTELHKTHLGLKISYDGGVNWTDLKTVMAQDGVSENDFYSLATDPAVVIDKQNDTVFMFGFRPNVQIILGTTGSNPEQDVINIPTTQSTDFIMFKSKDNGQTWEKKNITDSILKQVNVGNPTGKKYTVVFQGPGGGMVYQGKVYVPIQAWATRVNTGANSVVSTSGFMVSSDGGETWEVSKMLIPNVDAKLNNTEKKSITSESNIFYHKGKIRLAAKNEDTNKDADPRICYEYTQDAATGEWDWVRVKEDFLPKGVASIEGSTHSLSEDVYLVAFSYDTRNRVRPTLMTNTGATIQLSDTDAKGKGYTSITSDDNNIYVMYEGEGEKILSQMFKAIDWKHKDYAVLNTQMRNRAIELNEIQDKFSSGESFMSVSYSSDLTEGAIVGGSNGIKGGIFIRGNKNVEEDMPTVAEYDVFD
ncbi:sialidase family protein, partial [Anaerobiospirillum succiniciproducens]|uniref:sialidase family protein n=1 Tax=Anaerobiospirillum succiniciproducens TaxID=13335 RepID=UPI00248D8E36